MTVWYPGEAQFVEEAGLPSGFSTVVCRGENVLAPSASFGLGFGKQTAAWRLLQWSDCSANEMK